MIKLLIISFLISFFTSLTLIKLSSKIKALITDRFHIGPQHFHTRSAIRLGGIGIFAGLLGSYILFLSEKLQFAKFLGLFLTCSFPIFFIGLIEDLKGGLSPKLRLVFLSLSGILAFFLLGAQIVRVDIPLFDTLLSFGLVSFIFTVFAIVGFTNAINIIDGFNGLASGVSLLILLAIGYVAFKLGDYTIFGISLILIGALMGFFILNYPYGLIFLGDSGAYLIGFIVAAISIILVKNHPEVSAWFPLLLGIYPIYETLFSFYRKKILRGMSPLVPDGAHFHMLVYKIAVKKIFKVKDKTHRNPLTSLVIWFLNLFVIIPAVLFWRNTFVLIVFVILFIVIYNIIYFRLIKSKLPKIKKNVV
ncbi:glycosyltransferase family 4 protein [Thermodesulfovibrio hydrogeniphilus]